MANNVAFVIVYVPFFVMKQASRKKVYMLYSLEPDRSVTGGSWYTEQDFDSEFVDLIIMLSHRFLEQKVTNFALQLGKVVAKRQYLLSL